MSAARWMITLQIYRKKEGLPPHYDTFAMAADPDENVLDLVERVWAFHDRSLCYRHACHHSVCGACAMRVNGVEKLTCITPLREVTRDGAILRVDPLRNFPIISDLVVDMGQFYRQMEQADYPQVAQIAETSLADGIRPSGEGSRMMRLNDCIECGCCISACPVALTEPEYLGPAVLAGVQAAGLGGHPQLLDWVDSQAGLWRCHSVYECTAVCPSFVEPGARIMDLRRKVVVERVWSGFQAVLRGGKERS